MKTLSTLLFTAVLFSASAADQVTIRPALYSLRQGTSKAIQHRSAHDVLKASPIAAAKSDVIELQLTEYNTNWEYFNFTGDWYCTFMATKGADVYDFHLDLYSSELIGHYTEADLDSFYTWGRKNNDEFSFTTADITITEGAAEGLYNVDALVTTSLDETLHIVITPQAPSMDDIFVEAKLLVSSFFYNPDWYITVEDFDKYRVSLDFTNHKNAGKLEGSYTTDDCYLPFCMLHDMQTGIEHQFTDLQIDIKGNDLEHDIEITGSGTLDNTVKVFFHYLKTPPIDPIEVRNVEVIVDTFRFLDPKALRHTTFQATTLDGQKQFNVAYDGVKGAYNEFDIMFTNCTDLATGETFDIDHGQINVGVDSDNKVNIAAELTFKDSICYVFNASYALDVVGQKSVEVHNMTVSNLYGLINYMIGSNDEYSRVQASTSLDLTAGDYTNSMVIVLESTNGMTTSSLAVKQAIVTEDLDGNFTLEAQFLGDDMVDYTLYMDFYVPDVIGSDTFTSVDGMLRDLTVDYGAFQIVATDVNGSDYLSLVLDDFYVHTSHYSALSSVNRDYCQIIRNMGQPDQEILPLYTCYLDLTVEGKSFTLTGNCQAGTIDYTLNITGSFEEEEPQGDPYDDAYNDLELTFSLDDITRFDEMPQYGYAVLSAQNEQGESFNTLIYFDGLGLEEGVYEINSSYAPGTVQAGMIDGTQAYPTLYIAYDADGNALLPMWLCVAGTVTVSYVNDQISLLVDATNTWGRHALIQVNPAPSTGIEMLHDADNHNGKFLTSEGIQIRHNGRIYSTFGTKLSE